MDELSVKLDCQVLSCQNDIITMALFMDDELVDIFCGFIAKETE